MPRPSKSDVGRDRRPHREKRPCARPPAHPACHENGGNGLERRLQPARAARWRSARHDLDLRHGSARAADQRDGVRGWVRRAFWTALRACGPAGRVPAEAGAPSRSALVLRRGFAVVARRHFHSNWPPVGIARERDGGDLDPGVSQRNQRSDPGPPALRGRPSGPLRTATAPAGERRLTHAARSVPRPRVPEAYAD